MLRTLLINFFVYCFGFLSVNCEALKLLKGVYDLFAFELFVGSKLRLELTV